MARTYSDEQVAEFERHHGNGMVLVFTVGEDEYAFRRLSELDVNMALADGEAGKFTGGEQAAIRCVLTADAPHAGKSGEGAKLAPEDVAALVKERERLTLEWKAAPFIRDMIGSTLAWQCGYHWAPTQEAIGGGVHRLTFTLSEELAGEGAGDSVEVSARSWTEQEYDEYRRLLSLGADGDAERYAYGKLITSPNKDEVQRRYQWLVLGVGKCLQMLGVTKAVRLKKSGNGQAPKPGNSTTTEGAAILP